MKAIDPNEQQAQNDNNGAEQTNSDTTGNETATENQEGAGALVD